MDNEKDKPTNNTTIRMPHDLFDWVAMTAKKENRSINRQIVHLLQQAKEAAAGNDPA